MCDLMRLEAGFTFLHSPKNYGHDMMPVCHAKPNCQNRNPPFQREPEGARRRPAHPPPKRFYGHGIPGVDVRNLRGKSDRRGRSRRFGRSTRLLNSCIGLRGAAMLRRKWVLKRSTLVSEELDQAKQGNILSCIDAEFVLCHRFCRPIGEIRFLPALSRAGFMVARRRTATSILSWRGTWPVVWTRAGSRMSMELLWCRTPCFI